MNSSSWLAFRIRRRPVASSKTWKTLKQSGTTGGGGAATEELGSAELTMTEEDGSTAMLEGAMLGTAELTGLLDTTAAEDGATDGAIDEGAAEGAALLITGTLEIIGADEDTAALLTAGTEETTEGATTTELETGTGTTLDIAGAEEAGTADETAAAELATGATLLAETAATLDLAGALLTAATEEAGAAEAALEATTLCAGTEEAAATLEIAGAEARL